MLAGILVGAKKEINRELWQRIQGKRPILGKVFREVLTEVSSW